MSFSQAVHARQWRQAAGFTLAAIALYAGFRALPTGTNLSHLDFRPGGSSVEMCDPANPQFIPVTTVRSPVTMVLSRQEVVTGTMVKVLVTLTSASGRPVGPDDLSVVHTRKLHLLVIDPKLEDYQHLHPEPTETPGVWQMEFTPRRAGTYRIFADFTPIATGRGLYGFAEINSIAPAGWVERPIAAGVPGYTIALKASGPGRVRQALDWTLAVTADNGSAVPLSPVMGAYSHLVAFDLERKGYAHLHPKEIDPTWKPDPVHPEMHFTVTFPQAGRYVVWAQLILEGREIFVPLSFDVSS